MKKYKKVFEADQAWCIWRRFDKGDAWFPCASGIRFTRRATIAKFDGYWVKPGEYSRERRRGLAICRRCVIVEKDTFNKMEVPNDTP